jgi:predicted phage tail protein
MTTDDIIEDLVDLYAAEQASRGTPRAHIHRVAERRRRSVERGIPKASAARALGVSVPTLDKWIARGRVHTIRNRTTNRQQVDAQQLIPLVAEVRALRALGQKEAVLARAIEALDQQDDGYRRELDDLYGEAYDAAQDGDLEPVTLPESFGSDD